MWQRLLDAYNNDRGVKLSAKEVRELFEEIHGTVSEQIHFEDMTKILESED